MTHEEIAELLPSITPKTSEGADLLLDLRELLLSDGHPGKCVRCFFGLMGDLGQPGALAPMRSWLERHLEIEVSSQGQEIDSLDLQIGTATDLEDFCHKAITTIRMDRHHRHSNIQLRFRFKNTNQASSINT